MGSENQSRAGGGMMSLTTFATAIIFILTYIGVALGRIPGLRLDRAGIALTGAALMMAVGAITPEEAYRAIDLDTIALLLGMMIVVAHLKLSGFFRLVTGWALAHAHSPLVLLATVAVTTGAFSAFLVNDAVCLVMAPLIIEVTRSLRRDPVPYLLAVAMASNVGSTVDDHRQSAKYDYRCSFAHSLHGICGHVDAGGRCRTVARHFFARRPMVG
jgi:Na+/H+ antiporter NhaD/arsenite permease-like protein